MKPKQEKYKKKEPKTPTLAPSLGGKALAVPLADSLRKKVRH
jgi:hypothetical protein